MINSLLDSLILYSLKFRSPKFQYLKKYLREEGKNKTIKLLDVGCGNKSPSITKKLFPSVEYYGLDREEYNLIEEDKKVLEEHFFKVNLEDLISLDKLLPDDFFDFVIMNHVIEHTKNGLHSLAIISKKIRTGGVYILKSQMSGVYRCHLCEELCTFVMTRRM
jgi:2-polyprenyl-3-methyl-5-hydroxy-6-metoxy-1,4-benzoquinol methylase